LRLLLQVQVLPLQPLWMHDVIRIHARDQWCTCLCQPKVEGVYQPLLWGTQQADARIARCIFG